MALVLVTLLPSHLGGTQLENAMNRDHTFTSSFFTWNWWKKLLFMGNISILFFV